LTSIGCDGFLRAGILATRAENGSKAWIAGNNSGFKLAAVVFLAAGLAGCGHTPIATDAPSVSSLAPNKKASFANHSDAVVAAKKSRVKIQSGSYGLASYYDDSQTASGEIFDPNALTAAHRTLPFGTRVRVTELASRRSVTVRVNDRGPFVPGRVIDVSYAAAKTLGMVDRGVAKVELRVVNSATYAAQRSARVSDQVGD
jgi:rare lipoprotein A